VQLIVSPGCHYDVIKGGVVILGVHCTYPTLTLAQGFDTNIKAQISFLKGLM
jgi:hypothetical protein